MISKKGNSTSIPLGIAIAAWAILSAIFLCVSCERKDSSIAPVTNNGKKWRIAYYQGGDFIDYTSNLRALTDSLTELGWMEPLDIPVFDDPEDAETLWKYLAMHTESNNLEFVKDAFWSADWMDTKRPGIRRKAIDRLAEAGDIDLVIAMGTWAGQDLVNDEHTVPTMALTSSDPIAAGIIESCDDSGYDHVIVEVDPERYKRQLRLYYDILGFERLGVVYENSPDGRVYANIPDIEFMSRELGFSIVPCYAEEIEDDEDKSLQNVLDCYEDLAPRVDALWIGVHLGESTDFMPESLEVLFSHNIPTITSTGPTAVRRGVLMSIAYTDFSAAGDWYARRMAQILNGAKPGELDQVFEMPGQIVINKETARRIGFEFPEGILAVSDIVFETIEGE